VRYGLTRPTPGSIFGRAFVWGVALLGYLSANLWDKLRFRATVQARAIRLRLMLQHLGGAAIKIGQQLGLRADIIPIEYCDELMKLLDEVPPIEADVAVAIIEQETGKPLAESFTFFDPEPIGSGSIGCVFQATLLDGTRVAVKVRRPGIELEMRSDLKVLELLGGLAETLTIAEPGSARPVIREISRMLIDELDYLLEARQTEVFGTEASRYDFVTVPAVIFALSGRELLVTEFVDGVFLNEILNALEAEDPSTIDQLRNEGYDSVQISKSLVRMMFWQMYESDMFHADPHPANIVVHADNSLTLIDFGVCGSLSKRSRRALQTMHRNHDDPHEMAWAIIATQEPLPYIDVDRYAQELYYLVRDQTLAMRSASGDWYEKSSGALWAKAAEIGREYQARLNPELLRYMRTSFLGDSILARLNPGLDVVSEFRSCYEAYLTRHRNDQFEKLRKNWRAMLEHTLVRLGDLSEVAMMELDHRRRILERRHHRYSLRVEKPSFVVSALIKTTVWAGGWLLVWAGARAGYLAATGAAPEPMSDHLLWALGHPAYLTLLGATLLVLVRKLTGRLDEPDLSGR
jgi:predicted unusual protein kinase regulating ubiquinone biosynthesis (AarF/ABC1/UbiB family)